MITGLLLGIGIGWWLHILVRAATPARATEGDIMIEPKPPANPRLKDRG